MNDLPSPLTVVAHDAGGANQIISMLRANGNSIVIKPFMEGPAAILWQNAFPEKTLCETLNDALHYSESLITGTGWASELEYCAIIEARSRGMRTVAILDHWVNFEERFIRRGKKVEPDEYWVVDKYAYAIAGEIFPKDKIKLTYDYYLQEQTQLVSSPHSSDSVLYLCEPFRGEHVGQETFVLDYLMENLERIGVSSDADILIRPHPSESESKYYNWIKTQDRKNILIENSNDLHRAISKVKNVVGCQSYGLVLALACGRQVYSALPPNFPRLSLPHQGILELKLL